MGIYVHLVSDLNAEGPPVPIPNTEVKLCSGENTCLETSRKDSSLLTHIAFNKFCAVVCAAMLDKLQAIYLQRKCWAHSW